MSNIPAARKMLKEARALIAEAQDLIDEALALLDRRKAEFRAERSLPTMTDFQKAKARKLRAQGMSLYEIAKVLKTNHGRVSEAVSGKAH